MGQANSTFSSIWASEVAAAWPLSIVDAVDISDEQFPPPAFRPTNTRFWTHDSYEAFPEEYLGQFDVVNVRFMLYQVNDDVAVKFITNVLTLLSQSTQHLHNAMTWDIV
jgi:hypothetical protein